jgi:cytochrome c5
MKQSFVAALLIGGTLASAGAQEQAAGRSKSVADGVYSDVQAIRGAASYGAACGRCHRADLGGADGPPLRDERFGRNFAGKDLHTFYSRIATTMPRGAAASLSDSVYLDIVAHILNENGFPSGPRELTTEALAGIEVLPTQPKPLPPVGDFSYVEVVGCLTSGSENTWLLAQSTEPVAVSPSHSPNAEIARTAPLGTRVFRLLDAMAYAPESQKGQKVSVRGLLIRLPWEERMTVSAMRAVAPTCS